MAADTRTLFQLALAEHGNGTAEMGGAEVVGELVAAGLIHSYAGKWYLNERGRNLLNPSIHTSVRGIGSDHAPGCFVCGGPPGLYSNISTFVDNKQDGEQIVGQFVHGAWLDWRPKELNWIQVKIGACKNHRVNLKLLHLYMQVRQAFRRDMLEECEAPMFYSGQH